MIFKLFYVKIQPDLPHLSAREANVYKIDDMKEYTLTFLRPAPPKMSLRPSFVRQHLFPEYISLAPPVVPDLTTNTESFNIGSDVRFFRKSTLNLLVGDDNDADDDDLDDEIADEIVLQRILTRQYNSETDLRKFEDNDSSSNFEEESSRIVRSFSDSRLERKPKQLNASGIDEGIGDDHDFIKIDSNYHHAIEEVNL